MNTCEKRSLTYSSGPHEGCLVTVEFDVPDGPFVNGRTDRVTIEDPRVRTNRVYLVRQGERGYVLAGRCFVDGTTSESVRRLRAEALERLT